jgi:hypothetical protein
LDNLASHLKTWKLRVSHQPTLEQNKKNPWSQLLDHYLTTVRVLVRQLLGHLFDLFLSSQGLLVITHSAWYFRHPEQSVLLLPKANY